MKLLPFLITLGTVRESCLGFPENQEAMCYLKDSHSKLLEHIGEA